MLKHAFVCLLAMLSLSLITSVVVADPPPEYTHPDSDWMTWTLTDAAGDNINLSGYQGATYIVVFSANNEDSCEMMHDLADYIRDHPNKADDVLAMCIDDTGHKALKRHIRQEEWTKRVAEWNAEQAAARAAAEAAEEVFVPGQMPDFLQQIKDELEDEDDLADLMAHHFPFKAGCRCENMWDWLSERMDSPFTAPRVLKFNANGKETNEWTTLPTALGG
ncbi:MAG: hypothetical protein KDB68_11630 [Planctomycetes bacterium]|nr:hypothetical protein [Planctomycetota bacterium]